MSIAEFEPREYSLPIEAFLQGIDDRGTLGDPVERFMGKLSPILSKLAERSWEIASDSPVLRRVAGNFAIVGYVEVGKDEDGCGKNIASLESSPSTSTAIAWSTRSLKRRCLTARKDSALLGRGESRLSLTTISDLNVLTPNTSTVS